MTKEAHLSTAYDSKGLQSSLCAEDSDLLQKHEHEQKMMFNPPLEVPSFIVN